MCLYVCVCVLQTVTLKAFGSNIVFSNDSQGLSMTFADDSAVCLLSWQGTNMPTGINSIHDCLNEIEMVEARVEAATAAQYPRDKVGDARDVVDAIRAVIGW